jgi:hypothetical protein
VDVGKRIARNPENGWASDDVVAESVVQAPQHGVTPGLQEGFDRVKIVEDVFGKDRYRPCRAGSFFRAPAITAAVSAVPHHATVAASTLNGIVVDRETSDRWR